MANELSQDSGAYIEQIVMERDDALGTLRLRESDVRLLTRQLKDEKELAARLQVLLYRAVEVAERESAPGKVSAFIIRELKALKP